MEQPVPLTITVRPSKDLRPLLLKLAKDLDKSEGQIPPGECRCHFDHDRER